MIEPPIIVTGCQRSGTSIVTEILAKKYNLTRLGDRDLTGKDFPKLRTLLANNITEFIVHIDIFCLKLSIQRWISKLFRIGLCKSPVSFHVS